MSHLHLASTLIGGFFFIPFYQFYSTDICQDSIAARVINMNSGAYFLIDTLVLIDTIWVTHHSLSIGCSLFSLAGTRQVLGGSIYVWFAEIGGLLYHISRMWPNSKLIRQIFLVCYLISRLVMIRIATISIQCTHAQYHRGGINADFFVDATLTAFTTGVALVNLKFLYTNYRNYVKKFGSETSTKKSE